jgi:hypothetical protein
MNSQLLLVMIVLLVLIILLLIFKTKKQRLFLLVLFVAGGGWYGYREYTRTNQDLTNVKADVKIVASALIHEYETNDSAANKKYLGKVIEVDGNVKKVEKDEAGLYTVVLGDTAGLSSVRCSVDTLHRQDAAQLIIGSSAIVRGACTGFNKDEMGLGSDVILNRCVIIQNKK